MVQTFKKYYMEETTTQNIEKSQKYELAFFGEGSEYFKIMIVNWLLTLVTLGFYYPWARAKKLRYVYGQTSLNDERLNFSGTGDEMFRGFVKLVIFYLGAFAFYYLLLTTIKLPALALLFLYIANFAIIPFAIHGSFRYRMSRTSYRGIRFGYRGDRNELVKKFFIGILLTFLSLGIYSFWLQMTIRKYTIDNIRYGEVKFSNDADGGEWFLLNLKGFFLSLISLGIYSFWWISEIFAYLIDKMKMKKGDQKIKCYSTATGGGFFELLIINLLIIVFTLGFGKAWADMRTQKFIWDNIKMEGDINFDEISQTEEEYNDAFGDDAMDFFDIDIT